MKPLRQLVLENILNLSKQENTESKVIECLIKNGWLNNSGQISEDLIYQLNLANRRIVSETKTSPDSI